MKRLHIIIDTREQAPWAFPEEVAECRRGTLAAGDYALDGDTGLAVERKSLPDFVATIVKDRERFERELARMAGMVAQVVIVEAAFAEIVAHAYPSPRIEPAFVIRRVAELTLAGVTVLFADDPAQAAYLCAAILRARARELEVAHVA